VIPCFRPRRAGGADALVLVTGLAWHAQPASQASPIARESLAPFPLQVGGWRGEPNFLDPATLRVPGADDYINARFLSDGARVDLLMTFYQSQMGGHHVRHAGPPVHAGPARPATWWRGNDGRAALPVDNLSENLA